MGKTEDHTFLFQTQRFQMHHHSTASTLCTQPATGTNTICNLAGLAHFSLSLPQPTGAAPCTEIFFKKTHKLLGKESHTKPLSLASCGRDKQSRTSKPQTLAVCQISNCKGILSLMSEGKQKGKKDILQLTLDTHLGIVAVTIPNGLKTRVLSSQGL